MFFLFRQSQTQPTIFIETYGPEYKACVFFHFRFQCESPRVRFYRFAPSLLCTVAGKLVAALYFFIAERILLFFLISCEKSWLVLVSSLFNSL